MREASRVCWVWMLDRVTRDEMGEGPESLEGPAENISLTSPNRTVAPSVRYCRELVPNPFVDAWATILRVCSEKCKELNDES